MNLNPEENDYDANLHEIDSNKPEEKYFNVNQIENKTIDDGVMLIIEYVMQEKLCPGILPFQEKLFNYLKEKLENQVKIK